MIFSHYSFSQVELQTNVKKLTYAAYYNWGFVWVNAGQVDFHLSESDLYPEALKLKAVGYTHPSWDWVFRVRDTLISHYNPKTFLPLKFERLAHEGKYDKTFRYEFDYTNNSIYSKVHRLNRGRPEERDTVVLKPKTFDMLSIAWMTRELDFDSFKVNDLIPIRLLIDRKIYELYIRYHGMDCIRSNGKRRDCYVFSPRLVKGEMFEDGEGMKVYISDDKYRVPLMVEAKILVGSVKAILDLRHCDLNPLGH